MHDVCYTYNYINFGRIICFFLHIFVEVQRIKNR